MTHHFATLSVFHYAAFVRNPWPSHSLHMIQFSFPLSFSDISSILVSLFLSPWNDRLSRTLVAIPRFHPRDNLSPRYTISLRIRAILLIFHHPSTSSTFHFPPFPLRISTLWNATNDVSRHRKFRVIYLHLGLHLEKRERERKFLGLFGHRNDSEEVYSDSKILLNFIGSFEELLLYSFDANVYEGIFLKKTSHVYVNILHLRNENSGILPPSCFILHNL